LLVSEDLLTQLTISVIENFLYVLLRYYLNRTTISWEQTFKLSI